MNRTTITGKGQVTIPAAVREQLNLKNGDVLEFTCEGQELRVKVVRRYLVDELVGLLESDVPYPGSVEKERRLAAEAHAKDVAEAGQR